MFDAIVWWPIFGTLIGAAICFVFWARGRVKYIIPIQIAFFFSVPIASIISHRNDLFIAEFTGEVAQRYVGGHALKSLDVETPSGDHYRIEGVPAETWDIVSVGDHFIKNRGFVLTIADHDAELFRDGNITKVQKPTQGEQDGAEQPATAPQSKSQGNKNPKPESKVRSQ